MCKNDREATKLRKRLGLYNPYDLKANRRPNVAQQRSYVRALVEYGAGNLDKTQLKALADFSKQLKASSNRIAQAYGAWGEAHVLQARGQTDKALALLRKSAELLRGISPRIRSVGYLSPRVQSSLDEFKQSVTY